MMGDEMAAESVAAEMKRAWDVVMATEPALGKVTRAQLDGVVFALDPLADRADDVDALDDGDDGAIDDAY